MKVKEKELKKIIKKHYYMKIVVIELSGSIFVDTMIKMDFYTLKI